MFGVNALFVPTFWSHFYFDPYISILPLLVPNPINACYFSPFSHLTNRKKLMWQTECTVDTVNADVMNKIIKKLFII